MGSGHGNDSQQEHSVELTEEGKEAEGCDSGLRRDLVQGKKIQ